MKWSPRATVLCCIIVSLVQLYVVSVSGNASQYMDYAAKHAPSLPLGDSVARQKMVVSVTASDLRSKPIPMHFLSYAIDRLELSQLVFNEAVYAVGEAKDGWILVEAIQQPNIVNGSWLGYTGYIQRNHLVAVDSFPSYNLVVSATVANLFARSCHWFGCLPKDIRLQVTLGVWLEGVEEADGWWKVKFPTASGSAQQFGWIRSHDVRPLSPKPTGRALRAALVKTSEQVLGWYYFWGGRSAFVPELWENKNVLTGVDCSGTVGTLYRSQGYLLPRDAGPMFWKSVNVSNPLNLQAGDLFFYSHVAAPTIPNQIFHVMMYIGDNYLVESSVNEPHDNSTRILPIKTNFGVDVKDLKWGMKTSSGPYLFWGSFINDRPQEEKRNVAQK